VAYALHVVPPVLAVATSFFFHLISHCTFFMLVMCSVVSERLYTFNQNIECRTNIMTAWF
jgi:ABC-type spermidine/putrescine transport system permease subunit II